MLVVEVVNWVVVVGIFVTVVKSFSVTIKGVVVVGIVGVVVVVVMVVVVFMVVI